MLQKGVTVWIVFIFIRHDFSGGL